MKERLALRVRRVEGAPVVTVRIAFTGGARAEEVPGQALITGRLLAEGTHRRDWRRLARDAEDRGMVVSSSASFECHGLSLDALAGDWRRALEWAAEMSFEAAFPEDRLAWLARQAAAELESLADQPEIRCSWAYLEQLYGSHPLARRLQGDPRSLASLTPELCRNFHQRCLEAGATVIVAGEIDEDEVSAAVAGLFGAIEGSRSPFPEPPPPSRDSPSRVEVPVAEAADQAHLFLGHLSVERRHPDVPALEALAVILGAGAGLGGRIPARIREKEGLAYVAQAHTVSGAGLDPGRLTVYVGTAPATLERAETAAREELQRIVDEGVTEEELEEARAYLLGREPFRRETARQWTEILLEAEFYDLPLEETDWRRQQLAALDRETVDAAARRHLRPGELVVTVGRPARVAVTP